jgi:hypothetical protein
MPERERHEQQQEQRPARVRELIADITRRLGAVCRQMPPDEFDAMVRRMAEVEHKYEQRGSATRDLRWARPRATPPTDA